MSFWAQPMVAANTAVVAPMNVTNASVVGAYQVSMFHLITHAFFKALLFLSAGSVIHAMSDEQDMRKMGGIWKNIPITYTVMWIGSLALAGVFPFAGYFSKDAIIEASYAAHS